MADLLSVVVKTTLGHRCSLSLPRGTPVAALKSRLQEELGVSPDMQRLVCGGKMPKDDQTLESFITAPNTMIYMLRVAFETGEVESSPLLAPKAELHYPLIVPMRGSETEEGNRENDTVETVTAALEEWRTEVDNTWISGERRDEKGVLRPLLTTLQQQIAQLTPLLGSIADFIDTERISNETRVKFSQAAATALKSLAAASLSLSETLLPNANPHIPMPGPPIPLRPLQQILHGMGDTSLAALIVSSGIDPPDSSVLLSSILELCSAQDLAEISAGSAAPLNSIRSRLKPRLLAAMDGTDTSEDRRRLIAAIRTLAARTISVLPDSLPGLRIAQSLLTCIERVAERVVCLVIDYPERDFGEVLKKAVFSCVALWVTEAGKAVEGGPASVAAALKSVVFAVCANSEALRTAIPYILQLANELVEAAEQQTEAQKPTVSESELVASWTKTIERDVKQQLKTPPQRPFSRAYIHLSPSLSDPAVPPPTVKAVLESLLSCSLGDSRCSLSNAAVPSSLQQAFADAVEGEVFALAGSNPDFDERRFAGVVALWRRKTVDRRSDE